MSARHVPLRSDQIPPLPETLIAPIVRLALSEDLGQQGDVTSNAICSSDAPVVACVRARRAGIGAGYDAARLAMQLIDPSVAWCAAIPEGTAFEKNADLIRLEGHARTILSAERVCLNFLCALSGIATLTARYCALVAGHAARITATRKTAPGMRALQIRAVRLGGGQSHRTSLDTAMLIKDNHILAAGSIAEALDSAKRMAGHVCPVEIEIDTLDQLARILAHDAQLPDAILLDNMPLDTLAEAVRMNDGRCVLEASGGVSLDTVEAIARTGVDYISVGALTHSAPALDLGLDVG